MMSLLDLCEWDAAVALIEWRAGWLSSWTQADAYTGEQGEGNKYVIRFADGSQLHGYGDGFNIYSVIHPDGRVLMDG